MEIGTGWFIFVIIACVGIGFGIGVVFSAVGMIKGFKDDPIWVINKLFEFGAFKKWYVRSKVRLYLSVEEKK